MLTGEVADQGKRQVDSTVIIDLFFHRVGEVWENIKSFSFDLLFSHLLSALSNSLSFELFFPFLFHVLK